MVRIRCYLILLQGAPHIQKQHMEPRGSRTHGKVEKRLKAKPSNAKIHDDVYSQRCRSNYSGTIGTL